MNINLTNKHAVVCGSTRGIGRAAAIELASIGARITLLARNESALTQLAKELPTPANQKHTFAIADHSDLDSVRAGIQSTITNHGPVHILINNTGGPPGGAAIDANLDEFTNAFSAHLLANHILVQAVVPGMRAQNYGRIINIISTSVKEPIPGLGVSNTIRGAVAQWAKTLSRELGPDQITVNNILPGFTETDRLSSIFKARAQKQSITEAEAAQAMRAVVPLARFATASETAAAIAFLASPAAAYISGVNLPVDGGRLASL